MQKEFLVFPQQAVLKTRHFDILVTTKTISVMIDLQFLIWLVSKSFAGIVDRLHDKVEYSKIEGQYSTTNLDYAHGLRF